MSLLRLLFLACAVVLAGGACTLDDDDDDSAADDDDLLDDDDAADDDDASDVDVYLDIEGRWIGDAIDYDGQTMQVRMEFLRHAAPGGEAGLCMYRYEDLGTACPRAGIAWTSRRRPTSSPKKTRTAPTPARTGPSRSSTTRRARACSSRGSIRSGT